MYDEEKNQRNYYLKKENAFCEYSHFIQKEIVFKLDGGFVVTLKNDSKLLKKYIYSKLDKTCFFLGQWDSIESDISD